ncbi:bifunctional 4-hydroxy-2-oxoglutarate aldolase/2-dehydro-3-deoxy-phosphogluconate aldolase [Neobacillus sp. NPDC093182]|uniref:bifunctional 4-hydroxy-2-oxoglutarate aldolase/2-dehydro-3-deoxy-phosphogluconate aldolase n=1 Tax=Neobacillus sp. NPDC093182 TaxID=3364297 RepID=UPI0037FCA9A3
MKKANILLKLEKSGVIAVLRSDTKEESLKTIDALVKGGITGLEVTFTTPQADEVIRETVSKYKDNSTIVVGAGTVLDSMTARIAIMAGAEFVVSPMFDLEIAEICNLYQVPFLPGCMTITEMKTALRSGVDIIKLFPASTYEPSFVDAVKAPLPQVNIMPTGGVNLDNMEYWLNKGCVAVGVGGNLLAPAKTGDYDQITKLAKQYIDRYHEIKMVTA